MTTSLGSTTGPSPTIIRSRFAVAAAYAAQGLGYAVVVTSLPLFKGRLGIDDTAVALIILLVCATAALGSVAADLVARWRGSRVALAAGLFFELVALALVATTTELPIFIGALAVYGVGLGMVDAGGAMQGVLVQRGYGRDIMGGFFAAYTAAAIIGALAVAGASAAVLFAGTVLLFAAVVAGVIGLFGVLAFDPARAAAPVGAPAKTPLPRRGIWLFGVVILIAFTLDSGVSTWSTVYLQDDLLAAAAIAPLGYAAYQGAILLTRIVTDRATGRFGRTRVAVTATVISIIGCVVVALLPFVAAAIVGFALAGVSVGALVPLAFTSAGALAPARGDEVIARVNLFNYVGAVLGAVAIGLLADAPGLGTAFLIPGVALIGVLFIARRFRAPGADTPAPEVSADDAASAAR